MFIVKASGGAQAPSGAAGYAETTTSSHMPLLTELEKGSVGWRFYKHAAPNGAFAVGGNRKTFGLERVRKTPIPNLCRRLCRQLCRRMANSTKVVTEVATKVATGASRPCRGWQIRQRENR